MSQPAAPDVFDDWLEALEARHLANLRVPEVTRALRALSSAYVERRHKVASGSTLDSAGKRAAFALYYAPLHFIAARLAVTALGAGLPAPASIVDIGCGTGAAGAAWALAAGGEPAVIGIDRHPWAVDEARWTYRQLRLRGDARQGDAARLPPLRGNSAAIAAYALNEFPEPLRLRGEDQLLEAAGRGARILVIEPIARTITPWWDATAARVTAAGGRADEWRFELDLPPLVLKFAQAAGLSYREMRLRTLFL
jgi:protein-L-isoaspartate O-methyltransferase